jgi:hypothetical protein
VPSNKGMKQTKPGQLRSFAAYPRCWTDLSQERGTAFRRTSSHCLTKAETLPPALQHVVRSRTSWQTPAAHELFRQVTGLAWVRESPRSPARREPVAGTCALIAAAVVASLFSDAVAVNSKSSMVRGGY